MDGHLGDDTEAGEALPGLQEEVETVG